MACLRKMTTFPLIKHTQKLKRITSIAQLNTGPTRVSGVTTVANRGQTASAWPGKVLWSRFHQGTRSLAQSDSLDGSSVVPPGVLQSPCKHLDIPEDVSLPHLILNKAEKHHNFVAWVDAISGREVTYSQFRDQVVKAASALAHWGLQKGDVVTIFSPNCIEFATFYIAAASVGAVVSAVNPVYTLDELVHALRHSKSRLLVISPELVDLAKTAAQQCPQCQQIIVFGEADGCRPFSNLLEDDGKAFPENVDFNPVEDLVALPYSSGTTGMPKGVMLTHHNLVANTLQTGSESVMNLTAGEDVLISVLPMFHIYGQVVVFMTGLYGGSKIVTMPKFDPELYLNCVTKYRASMLHVAPPIALFFAKHPMVAKCDFSSVHTLFCGAAPLGSKQIEEAQEKTNKDCSFRQAYGLTEASPLTNCNPRDRRLLKYHTVGPAIPNTLIKMVDIETGRSLGVGEEGELCVQGPQVMKGYFDNPEATADTLRDGWLHTGDIGHYDEDSHVIISDRLKELIKYKGYQVAPAELEALLVTHPSILDAAVIGKPDERAGELPRAYVVLKPNASLAEKEVHDFVKGKVSPYKELSGGIEFRPEIPKSASGKILRRQLKAELLNKK